MEGTSEPTEGGEDCVVVEDGEELNAEEIRRLSLYLVGRLWTDTSFNSGALQATIKQIWRVKNGVEIRLIGENLFSFQFFNWKDKERVIQGEPWWFEKKVLVLCEINGREQSSAIKPHKTPFWVQVYDVPFILRSNAVVKHIGNTIGEFLDWENKGDEKWGSFLRIRVLMDLEKPLKKGTMLKNKNEAVYKINFKYESLFDFCYYCGRVGHLVKDCTAKENEDDSEMPCYFGPWMRASEQGIRKRQENMFLKPELCDEKTKENWKEPAMLGTVSLIGG